MSQSLQQTLITMGFYVLVLAAALAAGYLKLPGSDTLFTLALGGVFGHGASTFPITPSGVTNATTTTTTSSLPTTTQSSGSTGLPSH